MDTAGQDVTLELVSGEVVVLHPDDVAVLTFPRDLTAQDADSVREAWTRQAPSNRVIILGAGAHVSAVLTPTRD